MASLLEVLPTEPVMPTTSGLYLAKILFARFLIIDWSRFLSIRNYNYHMAGTVEGVLVSITDGGKILLSNSCQVIYEAGSDTVMGSLKLCKFKLRDVFSLG